MDFDIHQLDDIPPESIETAFETFRKTLLERFVQSPEGQEHRKIAPDTGFWAGSLMYYGYQYEAQSVPQMTAGSVRTIVTNLFPRKILLESPEQAGEVIPELKSFWEYLKREFRLPQANAILKVLGKLEPKFPNIMNDPRHFGMAKSLFAIGQDAGFDVSSQEGLEAFMLAYNASILNKQSMPEHSLPVPVFQPVFPLMGDKEFVDKDVKKAEKKKRKQAKQARKKNRKQRK